VNRDEIKDKTHRRFTQEGGLDWHEAAECAELMFAPDSPLVWHTVTDTGDVIDVRAALEALGRDAWLTAANGFQETGDPESLGYDLHAEALVVLAHYGITGPLADVILRLAEEAS
jgi:hypothetical protein